MSIPVCVRKRERETELNIILTLTLVTLLAKICFKNMLYIYIYFILNTLCFSSLPVLTGSLWKMQLQSAGPLLDIEFLHFSGGSWFPCAVVVLVVFLDLCR